MLKLYTHSKSLLFATVIILLSLSVSSQVISFKNYTLESGTAGTQGAVYRFSNVCAQGNVDALVTVTELHRVTLVHIDSMATGTDDGFQPVISSTGGKGDHYALFNITFVTAGTVVPLEVVNFSGTIFDLNGSNQINEYADITLANASWAYSNGAPAITVTQTGNTISGVSANTNLGQGIDTANKSNSYVVNTTSLSSLSVKFGYIQDVNGWSGNDQFSLLFTGSSSMTLMPIKLESFTAQLNGDKVQLKWTTSNQEHFSHFVIERSFDGKEFTEIAVVLSNDKVNAYQYTNDLKSNGVVYYRLKMVDIAQHSKLSMVRAVKSVSEAAGLTIQAYPNPVVNELKITTPASWNNKPVNYTVYATDGSIVINIANSTNQTEVIAMNNLKPGMYIVKVSSGNESLVKRIMKSN